MKSLVQPRILIACAAVLLSCGVAALAFASNLKTVESPIDTTDVSGNSGTKTMKVTSLDTGALKGFKVAEMSNKPCTLTLMFGGLPGTDSNPADQTIEVAGCKPNLGTSEYDSVIFTAERKFVGGVQVCLNADGDRIKGIEIHSVKVNDDGSVVEEGSPLKYENANCKTWKKVVSCDEGMVAVGATAHHTDSGIKGLALKCKSVKNYQVNDTRD